MQHRSIVWTSSYFVSNIATSSAVADYDTDEDVEHVARSSEQSSSDEKLLSAARIIREMCNDRQLNIVSLQPFMHYEGLLDREKHAVRIKQFKLWLQLATILRTELIGIPSSFLPKHEISPDQQLIVSDFQELADLAAPYRIRLTYEALCWGTYIDTWEQAWQIVQKVDRPNFGLCLDTFNMAGKMFADPEAVSGMNVGADEIVRTSLQALKQVDMSKVFCLQIVDAERLQRPLTPDHPMFVENQPSRMTWSRNCRLFYGEKERGAYLPILQIVDAIMKHGYWGPTSAEVFHACLTDADPDLPEKLAQRAAESNETMYFDLFKRSAPERLELDRQRKQARELMTLVAAGDGDHL